MHRRGPPASASRECNNAVCVFSPNCTDISQSNSSVRYCTQPWPTSAFQGNYCKSQADSGIFAMGYSVRSATHRYTRWMRWNGTSLAVHPDGWLDGTAATANLLGQVSASSVVIVVVLAEYRLWFPLLTNNLPTTGNLLTGNLLLLAGAVRSYWRRWDGPR